MAILEHASGTQTFGAVGDTWTELVNSATDDGAVQVWIDVANMAVGDLVEVRVQERVLAASTQRLAFTCSLSGAQSQPALVTPTLLLIHNWNVSIRQRAGAARAFPWSVRRIS